MAQAVLSHSASQLVTLDELATIPAGTAIGPRHRPVRHLDLVSTVTEAFAERGYQVTREQFSVTHEGARLFGTLDLQSSTGWTIAPSADGALAVGLRHANDAAFALGVVSGVRVFVCDNCVSAVAQWWSTASTRPAWTWPQRSARDSTGPSGPGRTSASSSSAFTTRRSPTTPRAFLSMRWPWTAMSSPAARSARSTAGTSASV